MRRSGLNAIATGLDKAPTVIRNGIAWCATEIVGLPEFPATVLAEVITRATLEPFQLKPIARAVRMVGTCLGDPTCARDLLRKDLGVLLADRLADVLHKLEEPEKATEEVAKAAEDIARAIEEVAQAVKKLEELEKVEELANLDEISSPVRRGWLRGPGDW